MVDIDTNDDLRERAIRQLRKKKEFGAHVLAYLLVNGFLIGVWAMTGGGFFWPGFVLLGWGIGVFFNAWDVYSKPPTEDRIRQEMDRLR